MTIIRAPRPESNWYQLDKRISEDRRLSWSARGLLIFLLGKPDHWRVSVQALANETQDALLQSGRDAVYRILRELQSTGYLVRAQAAESHGKFGEVDYLVSEMPTLPLTENPEAVPLPGLPDTDQPDTANPPLVNTDVVARTDVQQEQRPRAARFDAHAYLIELGVDPDVGKDWLNQRKKTPATQVAIDGIAREARKAQLSLEDALRECCVRGWRGFKADWVGGARSVGAGTHGERRARTISGLTGMAGNDTREGDDECTIDI